MMHFQFAGSGVMSAFYPHESELSRRVKQLIRAAKKQLEALCAMKYEPPRVSWRVFYL
ncbi:phage regulatory protein CIII [Escherichia coli O145:H28]|nr:phage regulatory protein CIII [Escherichia coli O145:H28]GEG49470.1 phage regulatory protein CIII [Escherichia coli O145:H28]